MDGGGPLVTIAATKDLPDYGWIRFRKADKAEPHGWQPQTVRLLQTITGATKAATAAAPDSAQAWGAFTSQAKEKEPAVLRDLLEVRAAAEPLAGGPGGTGGEPVSAIYRERDVAGIAEPRGAPDHHRGDEHARRAVEHGRGRGRPRRSTSRERSCLSPGLRFRRSC